MAKPYKSTQKKREIVKREKRAAWLEERLDRQISLKKAREYRKELQNINRSLTLRRANLESYRAKWDAEDRLSRTQLSVDKSRAKGIILLKKLNRQGKETIGLYGKLVSNLTSEIERQNKAIRSLQAELIECLENKYGKSPPGHLQDKARSKLTDSGKLKELLNKGELDKANKLLEGKTQTTRTRQTTDKGTKAKTTKASKPAKAKPPVKAKTTKELFAEHARIKKSRQGQVQDERDILLSEYQKKVEEMERENERLKNKLEGVLPGESLRESIAQASDGSRNTYAELIERMNNDPLYFSTLSEKTKIALLSSPRFIDVVFKEANPEVVQQITREDIYKQYEEEGLYDRWSPEVKAEWEAKGKKGRFEDEWIKQHLYKRKYNR